MDNGWLPDDDFLRYLESVPIRGDYARAIGDMMIREMRNGTRLGMQIYESNWKAHGDAYRTRRAHEHGDN